LARQSGRAKRIDYFYGGFLEDRTYLWRNHPTEKGESLIHLGTDYTVPFGTPVCLPKPGEVYHIMFDPENKIGWGGRLIFKLEGGNYLLFGHLKQDIKLQLGQPIKEGEIVGIIGETTENGNWWPHLHAQLMNSQFMVNYVNKFNNIDGYAPANSDEIRNVFNPEIIINDGSRGYAIY